MPCRNRHISFCLKSTALPSKDLSLGAMQIKVYFMNLTLALTWLTSSCKFLLWLGPAMKQVQEAFTYDTWRDGLFFDFVCQFVSNHCEYVTGIHPLNEVFQILLNKDHDCNSDNLLLTRAFAFLRFGLVRSKTTETRQKNALELLRLQSGQDKIGPFISAFLPNSTVPRKELLKQGFIEANV
jgi:hypothetical protein